MLPLPDQATFAIGLIGRYFSPNPGLLIPARSNPRKKQKDFFPLAPHGGVGSAAQADESFLVLFFKKELLPDFPFPPARNLSRRYVACRETP